MSNSRMIIISSYFKDESYGLLGPQLAATVVREKAGCDCIVVAVTRDDDTSIIKKGIWDYFGEERPIVAFSTLSGRQDLFNLAGELKSDGVFTILAGPQANVDFNGEIGWQDNPHRFAGLSGQFSLAMQGPVEQIIPVLKDIEKKNDWEAYPGLIFITESGNIIRNPAKPWDERYFNNVSWDNLFRVGRDGFIPLKITIGQVLQQIGCPYAAKKRKIEIDYPSNLRGNQDQKIILPVKGCSFCDVAVDKGFYGSLDIKTVLDQILGLPLDKTGRKIPFELINENPIPGLSMLLESVNELSIQLSQIHLIMRADWFIKGEMELRDVLNMTKERDINILISSMGFEAFDNNLLRNFNKGITLEQNLEAIRLMRQLKQDFPDNWSYSKTEGAIHGFIHPTPWDTREIFANTQKNIAIYGLENDILPPNSTPLIIHHASCLGDWIREVEKREGIKYKRYGSIIEWWGNPV